jgi:dihydroflavonol-4-reductase
MATGDTARMARHKMFYSSAKARRELGYDPRPARAAVRDSYVWFKEHGYI